MLKFPGGKTRALTFSYDDGVSQDMRLVTLFNLYGLKGTFNLNSGIQSRENTWQNRDVLVRRMDPEVLPALYAGHEIAAHTRTHPSLYKLSDEALAQEIREDKLALERQFGQPVLGMAYPFGDCDARILMAVRDAGLLYGRRVQTTGGFRLPADPRAWDATCHHNDERLMDLADAFLAPGEDLRLFYVWGHSYEFDVDRSWARMEDFCAKVGRRDDVWYATNGEIVTWMLQNHLIQP